MTAKWAVALLFACKATFTGCSKRGYPTWWCERCTKMLFIGYAICQLLQPLALLANEEDPVILVVEAYAESAAQIRNQTISPERRNQWRQDWLQRFLDVAANNPASPHVSRALAAAESLANSSGNFAVSQQIIQNILDLTKDIPFEQATWLAELGEVTKLKYQHGNQNRDRLAAIQVFEKANRLIESNEALATSMKKQLILNHIWCGELRTASSATKDELHQAANDYSEAHNLLKTSEEVQRQLRVTGYTNDRLVVKTAVAALQADDNAAAMAALRSLPSWSDRKSSMSLYFLQCAQMAFPKRAEKYREFIEKWLKVAPEDDDTAVLKFQVAESYHHAKDDKKAIAAFEELNSKYCDAMMKIDADAIRQGRGGCYADVLYTLRIFYVNQKEYAKAAVVNKRFLELFPNYDELTKDAKAMQPWIEEQIEAAKRKENKEGNGTEANGRSDKKG